MEDNVKAIANYAIKETIHESAEGVIFRATETKSGTSVLIKKYYPSLNWSEEVLNEFFNLVGYLRFIEHEYLLPIIDVDKHEGIPFIVFADDNFRLFNQAPINRRDEKELLGFISKIAEALDYLHKQELVHGNLQPENIVLDPNDFPVLFDFGLSGVFKKLLLENMDEGFENLAISNLRYTSPEQILGRSPSRLSDIYMFGIVGYYAIFNELPFDGKNSSETALSHLNDGVIKPLTLPDHISQNVLNLLQKCLQYKPDDRFESFTQILVALEKLKNKKRTGIRFKKRFVIVQQSKGSRVSPTFIRVVASVIGVLFIALFFIFQNLRTSSVPMETQATKTPTIQKTATQPQWTKTETPVEPTVETLVLPSPTATVETYQLAFESEKPFDTSGQEISPTNLSNLTEISRLGYGRPEEMDVASDEIHVAVATSAGVLIFEGGQLLNWIDPQNWATSVQFSPDGTILAVGLKTGEIQLWDWQTGVKSASLTGHTKKINRLIYSQNNILYSASDDQHIIVWNLKSNSILLDIPAHSRAVNDIAITSDARILVSCSDDGLIRVWDIAEGTKLYELDSRYFEGSIRAIDISSDDAYLAAGGEAGFLYQWNLITTRIGANTTPQLRNDIVPVRERIWELEYAQGDKELFLSIDNGKMISYDATRQKYQGQSMSFEIPLPSRKLVEVFGPDFRFDSFSARIGNSSISINWDGQVSTQEGQIISGMFDILDRLDFSPDGTILAAGGRRGSTHVWDLTTNQPIYKNLYFLPFGDPIAPDGSSIALIVPKSIQTSSSVLLDDTYQIKNLTGSQSTRDLSQILPNGYVSYTEDGNLFLATNLTESKAWDSRNGTEIRIKGYDYIGCWITTSESNLKDMLMITSAIGILPLGEQTRIDNLCPMTYRYRGVKSAFSDDLSLMAYINSNGLLEGFDVLNKTSPWPPYRLADVNAISVMTISPNGSVIAVGDDSGRITFINGKTGEYIGEAIGNFGSVYAIEFSESGDKLATAGADGIVRVFAIVETE